MSTITVLSFLLVLVFWLNCIAPSSTYVAYNGTAPDKNGDINQINTQSQEDPMNRRLIGYFPIYERPQETNILAEILSKLNSLSSKTLKLTEEDIVNQTYYDKHFNCIGDCSKPKCLSKSYPKSVAQNDLPKTCVEATALNDFNDGVYLIKLPYSDLNPFYVYCSHENANEAPWMIIQRREDGGVDFNRNWLDYKHGFGDLYGDYWLGLDRLHDITKVQRHELWISLKDHEGHLRYAKYLDFSIGSEQENYKLRVSRFKGDAGDSLSYHSDMKFSTFDNDNDESYSNCAQFHKGGWWYVGCYRCLLNGPFHQTPEPIHVGSLINWSTWLGYNNSMKFAHMAIRPL